jgi:hypothetical protein
MIVDYVLSDIPAFWFDRPLGNSLSQWFGWVFDYDLGSKLVFLTILLSAGYLSILLARYFAKKHQIEQWWKIHLLELLAMIFFLTNPFSYERMMTQPLIYAWVIALGYGLYFHIFRERYIAAGFAYAFSLTLFPHASYMILFILIIWMIFFRSKLKWGNLARITLPIVLLNLNWIVVTLIYVPVFTDNISNFGWDNLLAFATQAIAPLDVFFTNLLLYGFWWEQYHNHFAHVSIMSPYWYVAGFLIFALTIFGGVVLLKILRKKNEFFFFISLLIISLIFTVGASNQFTDLIREWLSRILPYWDGYREPQKWTGMILLVEAIFFVCAFAYILKNYTHNLRSWGALVVIVGMLLYIWSPGVYISYRNQMRTSVYPKEFYTAREVLRNEEVKKVLLLPWYSYIGCWWISRPSVANPSIPFFREFPLVVSERIDAGKVLEKNTFTRKESSNVEKFIETYDVNLLKDSGISHILFLKYCYKSDETIEYLDLLSELWEIDPILTKEMIEIYIIP